MVRYSQFFLYFIHLIFVISLVNADVHYTDADFSNTVNGSIISNATTGNVDINTSDTVTPVIDNVSGDGLKADNASHFIIHNENSFSINADVGIVVFDSNKIGLTHMSLNGPGDIVINAGYRGIFVGDKGSLTSDSKIIINSNYAGIWAYESGTMVFSKEVDITAKEHGIIAQKMNPNTENPKIVFNEKVTINVQEGSAVIAKPDDKAKGGEIEFNKGLDATVIKGNVLEAIHQTSIIVKGDSRLKADDANSMAVLADNAAIDITGKSDINGHVAGINGGIVNLNLSKESAIRGAMTTNTDTGEVNVVLTEGTWNITESSDITKLTLNNSTVNFIDTAGFSQLTTKTLSGNGLFTLRADFGAQRADQIIVTDTSSGEHQIDIVNKGNTSVNGTEKLTLVQTSDGTADFSLAHVVEAGGFEYGLRRVANNSKNWELYGLAQKTSTAEAGINFFNTSYLFNYIGTQTLFQRMGDLKATNGQEGDFWIRGFAGKLNSFNSNKVHGFTMNYNGYQLGIDKLLPMANGNLYVGAMLGYNHANPDYRKGSGTAKDYSTGLYSTYIDDNGFYVDAVAKYMYLKNHFQVTDTAGTKVTGTAKNHGYSLSLETGKRFAINNRPFYIEPQAQLTYSRMGSATIHASNGLEVMLNAYNSALARAGLAVGYQVNNAQNPIDIYLKPSYIKEFSGNTSYKLNNHKEKYDFSGGWVDTSLGINGQINNRHNIYGEISYANGDRFDKQQVNLGYRYQF